MHVVSAYVQVSIQPVHKWGYLLSHGNNLFHRFSVSASEIMIVSLADRSFVDGCDCSERCSYCIVTLCVKFVHANEFYLIVRSV